MRGPRTLLKAGAIAAAAVLTVFAVATTGPRPYVRVRPKVAEPGSVVKVTGAVDGCPAGDQVTLLSRAFKGATRKEFAGVPAIFTNLRRDHTFAARVRLSTSLRRGRFSVSGRCGGGNIGATTLRVHRPS